MKTWSEKGPLDFSNDRIVNEEKVRLVKLDLGVEVGVPAVEFVCPKDERLGLFPKMLRTSSQDFRHFAICSHDYWNQFSILGYFQSFSKRPNPEREKASGIIAWDNQEDQVLARFKSLLDSSHAKDAVSEALSQIEVNWTNSASLFERVALPEYENMISDRYLDFAFKVANLRFVKFEMTEIGSFLYYPGNKINVHRAMVPMIIEILNTSNAPFPLKAVLDPEREIEKFQFFSFLARDGFFDITMTKT